MKKIKENAFDFSSKTVFLYSLYFSVSFIMILAPIILGNTEVLDFSRQIGVGIIENVDVKRRINGFSCWFALFCIIFCAFNYLFNRLMRMAKTNESQKVQSFLNDFIILANCNLALRCITFFHDYTKAESVFYFSQAYILFMILALLGYILLKFDRFFIAENYEQIIFVATCASVPLTVIVGRNLRNGKVLTVVIIALLIFSIIFFAFLLKFFKSDISNCLLSFTVVVFSFLPLLTSLYIELIHVLNQHYIFVENPSHLYVATCGVGFVLYLATAVVLLVKRKMINTWKVIAIPVIVFGVSCLSIQIPISSVYEPDLFEGANSSVLISSFLNYGHLPIIEHYGGHMMTGVWEGILYAVINSDFSGVVPVYDNFIIPVLVLLFYYTVRMLLNSEMALFTCLLIPFINNFSYYGLGIIVCCTAALYIKKPSAFKALLLWGANVWCALYRLDLGYAFIFASLLALVLYICIVHDKAVLMHQILALSIFTVIGGILWFSLCKVKGIEPLSRLKEFLAISSSNQNWAYSSIGNTGEVLFGWAYFIIPIIMLISLLYMIFDKNFRKQLGMDKWIFLIILNLSYWGNFSRALVRHSLKENRVDVVFWSAYLFIALFICYYKSQKKLFIPVLLGITVLSSLIDYNRYFDESVIADLAVAMPEPIVKSWRSYDHLSEVTASDGTTFNNVWQKIKYENERVTRVEFTEEFSEYADKYKNVLNALLDADETYIDLINETIMYSIIGRETPVYVSQSPLQLSGEYSQTEFIREIVGTPIALLPVVRDNAELDGVLNSYRYYKVYEYIYQNYRPLCVAGTDFAIWCLNEKYDYFLERFENNKDSLSDCGVILSNYGYDPDLHNDFLGYLPHIWADYDDYNAIENKKICLLENVQERFMIENNNEVISDGGNYLLISASNNDSQIVQGRVVFGNYSENGFVEKYSYDMKFIIGLNNYLIRCSADYYWNIGQINAVVLESDTTLTDVTMKILEGD